MFNKFEAVSNRKRYLHFLILPLLAVFGLTACQIKIEKDPENDAPGEQKGVVVEQYSVLAFVENLQGSGLVLQINDAGNISPDVNGNVTFPIKLDDGSSFRVTVITQPTSPVQNCVVKTGTGLGTINGSDVSNVRLVCSNPTAVLNFSDSTPAAGAINVDNSGIVTLKFSADLDHTTVSSTSVKVMNGENVVDGQLDVSGKQITFTADQSLTSLREYIVTVTTDVKDIEGNALSAEQLLSFNTAINPEKWYRLTNKQLGEGKSLDTSNPDYNCQIADTGAFTGQYWRFTPIEGSEGYYLMQSRFTGEREALEGSNGNNICLFTGFADAGHPFNGQSWKLISTGEGYFRLQTSFKGDGYSLDAVPEPKLDLTNNGADQQWKLTEIGDVPGISVNQFVYVEATASYQYGALNAVPNIAIENAPADSDFGRWAMLADGQNYRLFAFKRYTNDTLYQFAFNVTTQKYEWGFGGLSKTVRITGIPNDADAGSIAMLYADGANRLYMRSKNSNAVHQFRFIDSSQAYEYGAVGSIKKIDVAGMPADTDWGRWAMLHDGTSYRLYAMKQGSNTVLYQSAFNSASGDYEYGFDSIEVLTIDQTPVLSDLQSFAMLHDGVRYRLYMLSR